MVGSCCFGIVMTVAALHNTVKRGVGQKLPWYKDLVGSTER